MGHFSEKHVCCFICLNDNTQVVIVIFGIIIKKTNMSLSPTVVVHFKCCTSSKEIHKSSFLVHKLITWFRILEQKVAREMLYYAWRDHRHKLISLNIFITLLIVVWRELYREGVHCDSDGELYLYCHCNSPIKFFTHLLPRWGQQSFVRLLAHVIDPNIFICFRHWQLLRKYQFIAGTLPAFHLILMTQ